MLAAPYWNEEVRMMKTESIAEVVAIKKTDQILLEPHTLLPQVQDSKAELRKTINRFRTR